MNLTKDDLQAIRHIVEETIESSDQQTAAGFEEVHGKLATTKEELQYDIKAVDYKVDQVFNILKRVEPKLNRTDKGASRNTLAISKLKVALQ